VALLIEKERERQEKMSSKDKMLGVLKNPPPFRGKRR